MIPAPVPADEAERLTDLRALQILDTPAEERFDRVVRLAARVFAVPIAYIALIDADRQWFKAKCGVRPLQTRRDESFCSYTILGHEALVVPDATRDDRFRDNPLVVGEPFIRFYAGHPLAGPNGHNVGTLCIADRRPRSFDAEQRETLRQLAALAEHELRMMDVIQVQHELLEARAKLAQELAEAAGYVRSLLPSRLDGPVRTDWCFLSSSQLGGDLLGYHWLDERRLGLYLLDVCGHGVGAALLSIAAHTALRREALPHTRFDRPGEVLAGLNRAFPMDENNGKFFTIWYGVYDTSDRTLSYANAGHPPGLLFDGSGRSPGRLGLPGLMIGADLEAPYPVQRQVVPPGGRLYLFSDGVFEVRGAESGESDRMLGLDGLAEIVRGVQGAPGSRAEQVLHAIQDLQGATTFADDFSLLEVEFP
jgi:sigma-B regulation protein RsbU (phosphoserine phosphatase)